MRLFLSSYGFGSRPEKLLEMIDTSRPVAVISNAGDYHTPEEQRERIDASVAELGQLGLHGEQFDLREYFSEADTRKLRRNMSKYGLVWVRGGNSFILRRAMRQSGFEKVLPAILRNDEIVYGGFSAGVCVATPTLKGIELCDDPSVVPEGYDPEVVWDGLGLVPYSIVPHYKSDHPESPLLDETVAYLTSHAMPFQTLRDGEVIIIDGATTEKVS